MAESVETYNELSKSQRDALWVAYHLDGSTPSTLSSVLSTTYQGTYNALQTLEDRGLVETDSDPSDGRRRLVECTERGKQVLADRQKWERGGPEVADA